MEPYYQQHLFICTNQKESPKKCCAQANADKSWEYLKLKLNELQLSGPKGVRVSRSGCLGRCQQGPCIVVYPEGVWYTYQDQKDLDLLIQKHFVEKCIVDELLIDDPASLK